MTDGDYVKLISVSQIVTSRINFDQPVLPANSNLIEIWEIVAKGLMRHYTPFPVWEKLTAHQSQWMAELRQYLCCYFCTTNLESHLCLLIFPVWTCNVSKFSLHLLEIFKVLC